MPPILPVEIWERIIDYLWDSPLWLSRCALVCKAWHARSRFYLIALTTLWNSRQAFRFAKLLDAHPELRPRVETVLICEVGFVSDWTDSRHKRRRRQPIPHFATFAALLAKRLPAVKVLKIAEAEWKPCWLLRNVFVHLANFTSITELVLHYVTFPSKTVLARIIYALPNLASLNCVWVLCRVKTFDPRLFCAQAPPIRMLMLDGPSDDVADLISLQRDIARGLESFRTGWWTLMGPSPSDGAIASILQHAGPALNWADIRLRLPPDVPAGAIEAPLTLRHCTKLARLYLACCLLKPEEGSAARKPPRFSSWLHALVASITSKKLNRLHIDVDVRHIEGPDASGLLELIQESLDENECAQIDGMLVGDVRFKGLKHYGITLLCGPRTPSPDRQIWTETIFSRFSQLRARHMLR